MPFAFDGTQRLAALRVLHAVGGVEVDDAVGLDGVEQLVLLLVGENADVFLELEQLLLHVGNGAIVFVADVKLGRQRHQFHAQGDGEMQLVFTIG